MRHPIALLLWGGMWTSSAAAVEIVAQVGHPGAAEEAAIGIHGDRVWTAWAGSTHVVWWDLQTGRQVSSESVSMPCRDPRVLAVDQGALFVCPGQPPFTDGRGFHLVRWSPGGVSEVVEAGWTSAGSRRRPIDVHQGQVWAFDRYSGPVLDAPETTEAHALWHGATLDRQGRAAGLMTHVSTFRIPRDPMATVSLEHNERKAAIVRIDGGEARVDVAGIARGNRMALVTSTDGTQIAWGGGGGLEILDWSSATPVLVPVDGEDLQVVAFDASSALLRHPTGIQLVSLPSGETLWRRETGFSAGALGRRHVAVAEPNGRWTLYARDGTEIRTSEGMVQTRWLTELPGDRFVMTARVHDGWGEPESPLPLAQRRAESGGATLWSLDEGPQWSTADGWMAGRSPAGEWFAFVGADHEAFMVDARGARHPWPAAAAKEWSEIGGEDPMGAWAHVTDDGAIPWMGYRASAADLHGGTTTFLHELKRTRVRRWTDTVSERGVFVMREDTRRFVVGALRNVTWERRSRRPHGDTVFLLEPAERTSASIERRLHRVNAYSRLPVVHTVPERELTFGCLDDPIHSEEERAPWVLDGQSCGWVPGVERIVVAKGSEVWAHNADGGERVEIAHDHSDRVYVETDRRGRWVALTSATGGTSFHSTDGWGEILRLYHLPAGWLTVDPQGHYDSATGTDIDGAAAIVHGQVRPLSAVSSRYTPGLLTRVLRDGERLPEVLDEGPAPASVTLVQGPGPGRAYLEVELTDEGGGYGRLAVLVDGREVVHDARRRALRSTAPSVVERIPLASLGHLPPGRAEIEVVPWGAHTAGRRVLVEHVVAGERSQAAPRLHALVVGISDHRGKGLDRPDAARDARQVSKMVEAMGEAWLGPDRVRLSTLVSGKETTRKALLAAVEELAAGATDADVLVVYLGGRQAGTGLLTSEAATEDLDPRRPAVLERAEVQRLLARGRSRQVVLVVDACGTNDPTDLQQHAAGLATGAGAVSSASGSSCDGSSALVAALAESLESMEGTVSASTWLGQVEGAGMALPRTGDVQMGTVDDEVRRRVRSVGSMAVER